MLDLVKTSEQFQRALQTYEYFDDFDGEVVAEDWVLTNGDSGTAVNGDLENGQMVVTPGASAWSDNDELYVERPNENYLFAAARAIVSVFRIQYTEANTSAMNLIMGLMSGVGADALLDDGAGPATSYSGAVLFKVDGGTVWQFESSLAGDQTTTVSKHTAGGAGFMTFAIVCRHVHADKVECTPFIDVDGGFNLKQMQDANNKQIKHNIDPGSATEMTLFHGAKIGSTTSEAYNIDFAGGAQSRA